MTKILSNGQEKIALIDKNIIPQLDNLKSNIYNIYLDKNNNINEPDCISVSTHKNSADSLNFILKQEKEIPISARYNAGIKQNINNKFMEDTKIRKDNFGREIKKGGKHKIAFADDLDIIQSLTPDNNNNCKYISRKSFRIKDNSPLKLRNSLSNIIKIKRSNSLKNDRSSIKKIIYNISKSKTKTKKKFKNSIVDIINVEKLKEENKLNTFFMKKRIINSEEENVCCSCYCSIY